jgi:nucleotide-binding universal stress UspA family protein
LTRVNAPRECAHGLETAGRTHARSRRKRRLAFGARRRMLLGSVASGALSYSQMPVIIAR